MKFKTIINTVDTGLKFAGIMGYLYFVGLLSFLLLSPEKKALVQNLDVTFFSALFFTSGIFTSLFVVLFSLKSLIKFMYRTWDEKYYRSYIKHSVELLGIMLFFLVPFVIFKNGLYISETFSITTILLSLCFFLTIAFTSLVRFNQFFKRDNQLCREPVATASTLACARLFK